MSDSLKLAIAASLLVAWSSMALAQTLDAPSPDIWVASCSQDGKLVYRERMTSDQANARQSAIVHRYPKATCIFIAEAGVPSLIAQDVFSMPIGTPIDDVDLDAALRAISGQEPLAVRSEPIAPATLPPIAVEPVQTAEPNYFTPPQFETMPGWIRLSTYRTSDIGDALDDWNRMVSAYPLAGRYIPSTVSTEDGYVMLSVGPVPNDAVEDLCVSAQSMDMDCTPNAAEPRSRGYDYLSMFFPSAFTAQVPVCEWSVNLLPQPTGFNRNGGRSCWRSPSLVPQDLPLPILQKSPTQSIATSDGPPLPRPRPTRISDDGADVAVALQEGPSGP